MTDWTFLSRCYVRDLLDNLWLLRVQLKRPHKISYLTLVTGIIYTWTALSTLQLSTQRSMSPRCSLFRCLFFVRYRVYGRFLAVTYAGHQKFLSSSCSGQRFCGVLLLAYSRIPSLSYILVSTMLRFRPATYSASCSSSLTGQRAENENVSE
ncbi:hypothetical protein CPB85DRAFT_887153 [Mucidula mucida]|nr:hypothetical protein CPB85DRAFT_887153 [Mucidula mucida]